MKTFYGLQKGEIIKVDGLRATVHCHLTPQRMFITYPETSKKGKWLTVKEHKFEIYDDFFGIWEEEKPEDIGFYWPEEPMLNPGGGSYNIEDER